MLSDAPQQVELVDLTLADPLICAELLQMRNSPEIRQFMTGSGKITRAEHARWLASLKGSPTARAFAAMVGKKLVGAASFKNIDTDKLEAEWGFYIAPEQQRKGYANQLLEKMLCLAFGQMRLHKLTACVLEYNKASLKLHGAMGFEQTSRQLKRRRAKGVWHDMIVLALERRKWLDHKPAATGTGIL